MTPSFKSLPIGIQTFELLIEQQHLYVDKSELIHELIKGTPRYFLSRPRGFGKSLLISTLESIFLAKKVLFKGLAIEKLDYSWESYPVIRLDMSKVENENCGILKKDLARQVLQIAEQNQIQLNVHDSPKNLFEDTIYSLHKKFNKKVVILIDEYDSPLVNQLDNSNLVLNLCDILLEFYRVTKSMDEYLQFVFITGVTNIAKASMFYGLDHLYNISLNQKYETLCGYTQQELETYFSNYIDMICVELNKSKAAIMADIKNWYNGYFFSRDAKPVYNPFSILQFFANKQFANYWYQTGTPSFLAALIQRKLMPQPPEFDHLIARQSEFGTLLVENQSILALLYQTGYLTIKKYNDEANIFELGYPNQEVKQSFLESLSEIYKLSEHLNNNIEDIL